jgi:chaperonin GroES
MKRSFSAVAKTKIKAKTKVVVKVKAKIKPKAKAKPTAKAKVVAKPKVKAKMSVQKRAEFLLQPLADRVVVRVLKGPKKTPGGLFIPDTATVSGHLEGEVLAVGSGLRNKKGSVS